MISYLLDTNIISHILRKNFCVATRFEEAISADADIILCPVVYYEIMRGLIRRDSKRMLEGLDNLAAYLIWNDLEEADWHKAAELWAYSEQQGAPRTDADILIASHAVRLGAVLVTDNDDHFKHMNLPVENWCR